MRTSLEIGAACLLAASLAAPGVFAQAAAPRARATVRVAGPNTAYLGIGVQDVNADRARALKLKEERGAEVTSVTANSPAAKAGFKEGDVVLEYNGEKVEGGEQLSRLVRETPVGREVKVLVWRNGAMQTLAATIGSRAELRPVVPGEGWPYPNVTIPQFPLDSLPGFAISGRSAMLGIEGESLGRQTQLAEFFGVTDGVLVKSVIRNSAAEKAGIRAGDVIVKVGDSRVASTMDITRALRELRPQTSFTVTVVRNRKEMPVTVTLEDRTGGNPVRAAAAEMHC